MVPATSSAVRVTCRSSSSSSRSSTCSAVSTDRAAKVSAVSRQIEAATSPMRSTRPRLRADISAPSPRAARRAMCSARSRCARGRASSAAPLRAPGAPVGWCRPQPARPGPEPRCDASARRPSRRRARAPSLPRGPGQQRVGGTGDGLTDQGEDPHEQAVDLVEGSRRRFVELDHDPRQRRHPEGGRSDQGEVGSGASEPSSGPPPSSAAPPALRRPGPSLNPMGQGYRVGALRTRGSPLA